ncbi:MAG: nitroreductase family protein [Candidatus Eisenbacteria bacterium]|jgi:nitroreductase|nr:nitroreductase family protein [Candidatus Eisenbacteria bacterium]
MAILLNERRADRPVDAQFLDRWSPRAFSPAPVPQDVLDSLFEAARWAPSCFNEQPWLFLCARERPDLDQFRGLLLDSNRVWADRAPVLAYLFARKTFERNGKPNRWAMFDCGAAWMSLALQARRLGLYAHAMAGFRREDTYEELGVPAADYEVICAIAIGSYGDPAVLPPDVAAREKPNDRKPISSFVIYGRMDKPAGWGRFELRSLTA